jgi:hypothetical protein
MTSGEESSPVRIGTAERTAAMKALDEHLSAGRLGVEEYADRAAKAANAVVASDLAELFTDLPEPHPQLPGTAGRPPLTAPLPVAPAAGEIAPRKSFLEGWGPRLVTITPLVAVLLFFITKQWYFFLLIPVMGALVYGGGVGRNGNSDRAERRDRD